MTSFSNKSFSWVIQNDSSDETLKMHKHQLINETILSSNVHVLFFKWFFEVDGSVVTLRQPRWISNVFVHVSYGTCWRYYIIWIEFAFISIVQGCQSTIWKGQTVIKNLETSLFEWKSKEKQKCANSEQQTVLFALLFSSCRQNVSFVLSSKKKWLFVHKVKWTRPFHSVPNGSFCITHARHMIFVCVKKSFGLMKKKRW